MWEGCRSLPPSAGVLGHMVDRGTDRLKILLVGSGMPRWVCPSAGGGHGGGGQDVDIPVDTPATVQWGGV